MSRLLFVNPPVLTVDPVQTCLYAESIPFGLLQILTRMARLGHETELLDMMGYLDEDFGASVRPERLWGPKPVGDDGVGADRDVFLYGQPLAWLDERLAAMDPPDEIFVTCCISFNYEPAFAVIERCRRHFPKATVRLGGFYATLFPEHAQRSGADEVFEGRFDDADGCFPDPDLLETVPPIWLFRLVHGCKYRCSFCVNSLHRTDAVGDPVQVADEILAVRDAVGITAFSNWDPNVMQRPDVLDPFLELMADRGAPVELKFEMGVQPNRLDADTAMRMRRAGVRYMTIPFESAEPSMMKRFGKPYRMAASMDAVAMCRELGFDTGRFHCTWVMGIRDESYRHVFGTYFGVLKAGGYPTPFPLSLTPGTREYQLHEPHVRDKDLAALNGHLWPVQPSLEQVALHDLMFQIINQSDPERAAELARGLPPEAARAFEREMDWYLQGPHRVGDPCDRPGDDA